MRNGQLTSAQLTTVAGGFKLSRPTAVAWNAMVAAAASDGVQLWIAGPYGAYRDLAAQRAIYQGHASNNPGSVVPVAAPGSSTHGWGSRVDVGSYGPGWGTVGAKRRTWLLSNAIRFGFVREFGDADPNHFAYNGLPIGGLPPLPEGTTVMDIRQVHYNAPDRVFRGMFIPGTKWGVWWNEKGAGWANKFATEFKTGGSIEINEALYNEFRKASS